MQKRIAKTFMYLLYKLFLLEHIDKLDQYWLIIHSRPTGLKEIMLKTHQLQFRNNITIFYSINTVTLTYTHKLTTCMHSHNLMNVSCNYSEHCCYRPKVWSSLDCSLIFLENYYDMLYNCMCILACTVCVWLLSWYYIWD